jgi:tetratricopeptide (TPR) repeat protein
MLTGQDTNIVALDYYLTGVKTDPRHFGSAYNVACSFYIEGWYLNAFKWFNLALKLSPLSNDSLFGKTLTCLKLGKYELALQTIN